MAIHRTIDHEEIREWIEKHKAYPAVIAGSGDDETDGDLTLSFKDPDMHALHISWEEFLGMFEVQHLRFRYEDTSATGEDPRWAFAFEGRDLPVDLQDETRLPEEIEHADENMFPSAPVVELAGLDLPDDIGESSESGEEVA
jgi:hypothetical protein